MPKFPAVIAASALVATAILAQHHASLPSKPVQRQTMMVTPHGSSTSVEELNSVVVLEDVGLRVDGEHDGRVVGTLVAKVDGRWVAVELSSTNARAAR